MNFKSDMICNICKKFLNQPISLPCHCCVCYEHLLSKPSKFTSKSIKCLHCRKEYSKVESFKRNELAEKIIIANLHLSDEEKSLKNKLSQVLDETQSETMDFEGANSGFEVEINEHFAVIHQNIEFQRDEFKNKIDEIASMMSNQVKQKETELICIFKQMYSQITSRERVDETKKLLDEFRDPNMKIENMQISVDEQERSLVDFKQSINEFKLKLDCIDSLYFRPNLNTNEETFGLLNLNHNLQNMS